MPFTDLKVLIINESAVETSLLLTLLSPMTRNLTSCTNYSRGLSLLQEAAAAGSQFELVFLSLPAKGHPFFNKAVKTVGEAKQSCGPSRTVLLGGEELPAEFSSEAGPQCCLARKPIYRNRLENILASMGLNLPKLNCWQYMECGRGPGGSNIYKEGTCPAAGEEAADGLHGGKGGGRACWAISGTLCGGKVQGSFAGKIDNCMECDFYQLVQLEEKENFESINSIMRRLQRRRKK